MTGDLFLFSAVLGERVWHALPAPVREMHGAEPRVRARGRADVEGATHWPARMLRRVLRLPRPCVDQRIDVLIERDGMRESWTRQFELGRMHSRLDGGTTVPPTMHERLGPVTFEFNLCPDAVGIDWHLRKLRFLGIPMPAFLYGRVQARCDAHEGRYRFDIDARLPLLGQLVAYRGWLERVADDC